MNYAVANRIAEARSETASVRKELAAARDEIAELKRQIARLERASEKRNVSGQRAGEKRNVQKTGVVKRFHVRVQLPPGCLIKD